MCTPAVEIAATLQTLERVLDQLAKLKSDDILAIMERQFSSLCASPAIRVTALEHYFYHRLPEVPWLSFIVHAPQNGMDDYVFYPTHDCECEDVKSVEVGEYTMPPAVQDFLTGMFSAELEQVE